MENERKDSTFNDSVERVCKGTRDMYFGYGLEKAGLFIAMVGCSIALFGIVVGNRGIKTLKKFTGE